mmetsp:Transcript_67067/g.187606  ORF Transcript_67067/g.187606 Transcript_67067/m.187606 type:complete len:82 (-) Transcript_67067:940-1185(-)
MRRTNIDGSVQVEGTRNRSKRASEAWRAGHAPIATCPCAKLIKRMRRGEASTAQARRTLYKSRFGGSELRSTLRPGHSEKD